MNQLLRVLTLARAPIRRGVYLGCLLLSSTAIIFSVMPAAAADTSPAALSNLALSVERARLDNGLRVVLNVDHSAPNVAICMTYDVGSRNEVVGRSGFAHLFEHMMFQGSGNVEKGGHFTLITSRGGSLNGTTSSDRTNYYESLPSNGLSLGLWLEADRLKSLAVTQENFENQRKVVQEEYRMRVSNAAYALGSIKLSELAFGDYWPYAHSTIGSMKDLDDAKLEWIREFHSQYYAPNNAVLSVSGDFDKDEAMRLIRSYFASAKPSAPPPYAPEPPAEQTAPRSATLTDANASTPGLLWGFTIPQSRTAEHYALEIATMVLAGGESSRLHQLLVREKGLARSASVWTNDHRGPDLFVVRTLLSEQGKPDQVRRIVEAELKKLATEGPQPAELEKAKNQVVAYFLFALENKLTRAQQLANYELFYGDARLLTRESDEYLKVTSEQVRAAMAKYITPARTNFVTVMPEATPTAVSKKGQP